MNIAGNDGDDDDNSDLDLNAGYETETKAAPPIKTEAKETPAPVKTEETKPAPTQGKKPEAAKPQVEAKQEAEAPKYRQITEEEWNNLSATANKTASLEKQISTALGTIGNIKQLVTKLQTETPKGVQIELPKEFLKKLRATHPDLAISIEEDLTEAFRGIKGTGGDAKETTKLTEEDFDKKLQAARLKDAVEALEDEFPTWRQTVGEVDAEGKHDPKNPFRKWLATQSAEYQEKINSTNNPYVIANAIRRYRKAEKAAKEAASNTKKTSETKPSPKQEARSARISSAVTPKGAGGSQPSRNSADDDFEAGYASERGG